MPNGTLRVDVTTGSEALPVAGALVVVRDVAGRMIRQSTTNENGTSDLIALDAPDRNLSLDPNSPSLPYAEYLVDVTADGFAPSYNHDIQIFDDVTSVLPVHMEPVVPQGTPEQNVFSIGSDAYIPVQAPVPANYVVIPETVTVHLGPPGAVAPNVTVPFIDYIKNVASSEIYPTWPLASLEANIYAQISFVLNRIYTEWYRVRGYDFDITNTTAYDQYFVDGRNIFSTVSAVVDRIFNTFIRRRGFREPFFASFCNGTTSTCAGLSQWGTVPLANQGMSALEILRQFYPPDVELATSNNFAAEYASYPGVTLSLGSSGSSVRDTQDRLNRIRVNFPLIPAIANPNGNFGPDTQQAVQMFQQAFGLQEDGVVGQGTWNKIMQIYNAVRRLSELDSEGERIGIGEMPPVAVLREGSRGNDVFELQYIIDIASAFYASVPRVSQTGVFDTATKAAVIAFQQEFGLTQDGVVGPATWQMLYNVYNAVSRSIPPQPPTPAPPPPAPSGPVYPGTPLRQGSRGNDVLKAQQMINVVAGSYPAIPRVSEDGIFGPGTRAAVVAMQQQFGLTPDGVIGAQTWAELADLYVALATQATPYPGSPLRQGARGDSVRILQEHLNRAAARFPSIPSVVADGAFGPATRNAVVAFQRQFNLTPDGVVGPVTWSYLVNVANQ